MRDQVEQGRQQMHQRFDLVDKRLSAIHQDLVDGLGTLSVQLSQDRAAAMRHSQAMQAALRHQHRMLADLYPLTVDRSKAILDSIRGRALGPCLNRKAQNTQPLDGAEFDRCVAVIRALRIGR